MTATKLRRTGTFILAFCAALVIALLVISAFPQTPPPVTSKLTFTLTGGGTATLFRSDSTCSGASAFAQVGSISATGFSDVQPSDGRAHCYYAMLTGNVPTNEIEWTTPLPAIVTVKSAGQDLTAVTQ